MEGQKWAAPQVAQATGEAASTIPTPVPTLIEVPPPIVETASSAPPARARIPGVSPVLLALI